MDINTLSLADEKLRSVIHQLQDVDISSFPHQDTASAIETLKKDITRLLGFIRTENDQDPDPDLVSNLCFRTSVEISDVLEVLGLILNSTSVKNSFEFYTPLISLARKIISDDIKLILSFEYNYVPFTYPLSLPSLPNFVIIGLPASESGNALILPATGHELGHSIWRHKKINEKFDLLVRNLIKDEVKNTYFNEFKDFYPDIENYDLDDPKVNDCWKPAHYWSSQQIEEIFCDLVGLFLFGPAYGHAFAYLISPTLSGERSPEYPKTGRRAHYLTEAAKKFEIALPDKFESFFRFEDDPFPSKDPEALNLIISDEITERVFPDIINEVRDYLIERQTSPPKKENWTDILSAFREFVPAENIPGLPEIINAGWELYYDHTYLSEESYSPLPNKPQDKRRLIMINELILKTIEVFEIEKVPNNTNDS